MSDDLGELCTTILLNEPDWYLDRLKEFTKARPRFSETKEEYDELAREYIIGCYARRVEYGLRFTGTCEGDE